MIYFLCSQFSSSEKERLREEFERSVFTTPLSERRIVWWRRYDMYVKYVSRGHELVTCSNYIAHSLIFTIL